MQNQVAIIDLGTNTFHLLIANWDGANYKIAYRERVAVKIGMGGINDGVITEAGIQRALSALASFKSTLLTQRVTKVFAFGTSALRNARNAQDVIARVKSQTGIEIKIITGDEEATYIYQGVQKAMDIGDSVSMVIDIGGGSVEFIIGTKHEILWKQSFEIGAQRLLERYQKHDPILPEEINNLNSYFNDSLKSLFEAVKNYNPTTLIGSSGTFDTLSDIHSLRYGIPQIPDAPETLLTIESFNRTFKELTRKNRTDRLQIPGMIEMRVDMIVVACCLIDYLLKQIPFKIIRVSSYSLKEGVLAGMEHN